MEIVYFVAEKKKNYNKCSGREYISVRIARLVFTDFKSNIPILWKKFTLAKLMDMIS